MLVDETIEGEGDGESVEKVNFPTLSLRGVKRRSNPVI